MGREMLEGTLMARIAVPRATAAIRGPKYTGIEIQRKTAALKAANSFRDSPAT
jgi:hypothetical protein